MKDDPPASWRNPTPDDVDVAVARRRQILLAAEECFKKKGFHGASVNDIANSAQVSAGNLYYYFANKEEIIAAIAEAELEALFEIHESVRNDTDLMEAIARHSGDVAMHYAKAANAKLILEVLAESGRNPRVSALVQDLDQRRRRSAYDILRLVNTSLEGELLEATITMQYELISAVVAGFMMRAVRGVEADERLLRLAVMDTVRVVLASRAALQY